MPAPITVIIPTLNAENGLRRSLPPLFEGITEGLIQSVIFADGGSTDRLQEIAEESGAEIIVSKKGRGTQLQAGIKAAKSSWYLILHADTVLPTGWSEHARQALTKPEIAHVFQLQFDTVGFAPRFVAGWANMRTRLFGLPYGDQALLISRALYDRVGGYPDIPLMEDVALARALQGRINMLDAYVITSAERYERDGWLRRGARNLSILARYLIGADPEKLARSYRSPTKKL